MVLNSTCWLADAGVFTLRDKIFKSCTSYCVLGISDSNGLDHFLILVFIYKFQDKRLVPKINTFYYKGNKFILQFLYIVCALFKIM